MILFVSFYSFSIKKKQIFEMRLKCFFWPGIYTYTLILNDLNEKVIIHY